MVDTIGDTAGKVWQVLDGKESLSVPQLKKATGADEKVLWLALGWLARENKISIAKNKASIKISLKH
ncbi:MAG: winged helix-turn-helix domain-containing protein [bacterium]